MALTPIKLTFEEFCQLPESNLPHELIEGELRMPAAPNVRHQVIVSNIGDPMRSYVRGRGLGLVLQTPVDVVLDAARPLVLQPDALFVSQDRLGIVRDKVYGAPDLAVEVFSGSGAVFDRTERVAFFAQYGVREYWLVDPETEAVEVRRLEARGYETVGRFAPGQIVRSTVLPDLNLSVDDIFAK